ncbi:hypothetical protein CHUAL_002190 [Chamberlinius hualienensis]
MSSPTIDTFCCVVDSSGIGIDTKLEFRIDLYTIVCIVSSFCSILGAIYQLIPRPQRVNKFKRLHFSGSRQRRIIAWLAIADLMAALGILTRSIFWLYRMNDGVENNNGGFFCAFSSGWIQFFYTATYFWTICYAVDVLLVLQQKEGRSEVYHLICWGLPAITTSVGISILYNPNLNCSHNIENVLPNYLCTHIPLLLAMTINPILYWLSSKKVYGLLTKSFGTFSHHERQLATALKRKFFDIVLVFYICWMPNIINSILLWSMWYNLMTVRTIVLSVWYIMAVLNPLQAVFNALVYRSWDGFGGTKMLLSYCFNYFKYKREEKSAAVSTTDTATVDSDYDSDAETESTPFAVNTQHWYTLSHNGNS